MPSDSSRRLIVSLASITFTEKCLPTSRRNVVTGRAAVQVTLFSSNAPDGPSKSTNRSSWPRIRSVHSATVSTDCITRSPTSRGSPTMPVAPPASTIGRCPARWNPRSPSSGIMFPACRLGPGGEQANRGVRVGEVGAVVPAVQAEHAGEPGRALGQLGGAAGGRAALCGEVEPGHHLAGPEQDRAGQAVGQADHVGAEVHAIHEVDVEVSGRAEHHLIA